MDDQMANLTLTQLPGVVIHNIAWQLLQKERVSNVAHTLIVRDCKAAIADALVQANLALTCKALQGLLLSHYVSIHGNRAPANEARMRAFNASLQKQEENGIEELRVTNENESVHRWPHAFMRPTVQDLTPAYRCLPHHPHALYGAHACNDW